MLCSLCECKITILNEKAFRDRGSGFKVILEIIITVLLGIISPTLTAYQYRKEKKTGKKRDTRIGASLWFIMIGFFSLLYLVSWI